MMYQPILASSPERPTLLAYLPETSIVVVAADWIEASYEDAWESVRAMPGVGAEEKSFSLQGRTISSAHGVLVDENGTLAGTDIDMATTVRNAVELLGLELSAAARMASQYPAEFLGLGSELGRIAPGYRANLALFDDRLQIRRTWIDGISAIHG